MRTREIPPAETGEIERKRQGAPEVSIVVGLSPDTADLVPFTRRLHHVLDEADWSYELIVVDETQARSIRESVQKLAGEGYPVRLLLRHGPRDYSRALAEGLRRARGDLLVCMDADMSHPPEAVPLLLDTLEEDDAEFALGVRYVSRAGAQALTLDRVALSKIGLLLARSFTSASDPLTEFFAVKRPVFKRADAMNPAGSKLALELLVKAQPGTVRELPISFHPRTYGHGRMSLEELWKFFVHLKRLSDYQFGLVSTLFQFLAVGGTGTMVDFGALNGLLYLDTPLTAARGLAIWIAMTWNFFLNRYFTFSARPEASLLHQYGRFVASCSLGAFVNWGVFVGTHALLAPGSYRVPAAFLAGVLAGLVLNFTLSHWWVFPHPPTYDAQSGAEPPQAALRDNH